jgi:DNA-binding MarR family transcriptional regulator
MTPYQGCIIYLLGKAFHTARSHLKERLRGHGLTPVQLLILELLEEEEGLSAGDIVEKLTLDRATLSGVLDRMAQNGWITKNSDDKDRRFIRVYLTDKSREIKPLLVQEREQANEEALADLSLEEKVLLKRLLQDIR